MRSGSVSRSRSSSSSRNELKGTVTPGLPGTGSDRATPAVGGRRGTSWPARRDLPRGHDMIGGMTSGGTSTTGRQRSWWGWGRADAALPDDECVALAALIRGLPDRPRIPPRLEDLELPPSRLSPPSSLPVTTDDAARAAHTYGKAYRDVVRALSGDLRGAPDAVARPADEDDVVRVLDWAGSAGVVVVPFGGGSSVVGGVEYRGDLPWLSMDLTALDRVLEVDAVSRAARIQGGALGPVLEGRLRPHGLTLRHFPQSFEFSTLGGWLATRAGGHYATLHTHIDDLVESLRVETPVGINESWRPGGGGAVRGVH